MDRSERMADSDLGKEHEANATGHADGTGKTKAGPSNSERPSNPAGPHAKPELTDESKTPGSGMLSEPDDSNDAPSG
jgi:hypothetical protein